MFDALTFDQRRKLAIEVLAERAGIKLEAE